MRKCVPGIYVYINIDIDIRIGRWYTPWDLSISCLGRWDKKRYAGLSFGSAEDKGKLDFKAPCLDEKMEGGW